MNTGITIELHCCGVAVNSLIQTCFYAIYHIYNLQIFWVIRSRKLLGQSIAIIMLCIMIFKLGLLVALNLAMAFFSVSIAYFSIAYANFSVLK